MAGRGPQTFKKRQKEQQRKEKQAEKLEKRLMRKHNKEAGTSDPESDFESAENLQPLDRLEPRTEG
jgi:hypothetical protein